MSAITFPTLDDIDKNTISEYYCANIHEKTFDCSNKLIYKPNGGFGLNYKYCSSCYRKWDELHKNVKLKDRKKIIKNEISYYAFSS